MEKQDILEEFIHGLQIIRELVLIPIQIPCHISQRKAVTLVFRSANRRIQRRGEIFHLFQVVRPVGQVHVAQDKESKIIVIYLNKFKVFAFCHFSRLRKGRMEFRQNAVRRHFVARRNNHEHIFPLLLRLNLIDTVLVGLHDIRTVRNEHVRNTFPVALDDTVDVHTIGRLDNQRFQDGQVELAHVVVLATVLDIYLIRAAHDILRQADHHGGTVIERNHRTGIIRIRCRPQDNLVISREIGLAAQGEGQVLPCRHLGRSRDTHIRRHHLHFRLIRTFGSGTATADHQDASRQQQGG